MLAVAIGALVLTNALLILSSWHAERRHADAQRDWARERRELINRIQRPDYLPLPTPERFELPEPEPDEIELVNTIAVPSEEP